MPPGPATKLKSKDNLRLVEVGLYYSLYLVILVLVIAKQKAVGL